MFDFGPATRKKGEAGKKMCSLFWVGSGLNFRSSNILFPFLCSMRCTINSFPTGVSWPKRGGINGFGPKIGSSLT